MKSAPENTGMIVNFLNLILSKCSDGMRKLIHSTRARAGESTILLVVNNLVTSIVKWATPGGMNFRSLNRDKKYAGIIPIK